MTKDRRVLCALHLCKKLHLFLLTIEEDKNTANGIITSF